MGMFQANLTVTNINDPSRSFENPFWVDTGALYTFIPEDALDSIGVEAIGYRNIQFADRGNPARCRLGQASIKIRELNEPPLICQVVFAPAGSMYLLGATTLEAFSVDVDVIGKSLKPAAAIIASAKIPGA